MLSIGYLVNDVTITHEKTLIVKSASIVMFGDAPVIVVNFAKVTKPENISEVRWYKGNGDYAGGCKFEGSGE